MNSYDVPQLNLREDDYEKNIIPALIRCGSIPKSELKDGHYYYGNYRNSDIGMWMKDIFKIRRSKFGTWFEDECNHFEDNDGLALFVPLREANNDELVHI